MAHSVPQKNPSVMPLRLASLRRCRRVIGWIAVGMTLILADTVAGQVDLTETATQPPATARAGDFAVELGLTGQARLGHWTPIFVHELGATTASHYGLTTLDGDNVPVEYRGPLLTDPERPATKLALVKLGRTESELQLNLYAAGAEPELAVPEDQSPVASMSINLAGSDVLPSTQSTVVCLSATADAESADAVLQAMNAADTVVGAIDQPRRLPSSWLGYASIDVLVILASDANVVQDLTSAQREAMETWIRRGGKLLISVSEDASELMSVDGALSALTPGRYLGHTGVTNSSRLESFAASKEQLIPVGGQPLRIATFEPGDAIELISDGTTPLVYRQARGLGEIVWVAFDLASPRLQQWPSFNRLVDQLLIGEQEPVSENLGAQDRNTIAHWGYTDLTGQLRVPLDQFARVGFVAFTWIALLIGLYIICIGPVDYFLLQGVLKKMELTWITFPLFSLLFCGLALSISFLTRPNEIQLNQLEIIDVDAVSGRCRGSVWTTLYSPDGGTMDISIDRDHGLGFAIEEFQVGWQGLPGSGLGGMSSRPIPALDRQAYQQWTRRNDEHHPDSSPIGFPLQVASSRALFSQWWADCPVLIRSRPTLQTRSDRVTGAIKNPFDFEIRNCRLLVDTWAYVLDQPLGPGQSFDIQTGSRERTLKSNLTRRKRDPDQENRGISEPWDPTDVRVSRIADMLMFYRAAGGGRYTGLTHGYQSDLDLSGHLGLNRAMLVGEISGPAARLVLGDGATSNAQYDQETVVIRILLPVEIENNR